MSQSTVSHHLQMMQKVGLLDAERIGQRTYYRRNEQAIDEPAEYLKPTCSRSCSRRRPEPGPYGLLNIDK